MSLLSLERPKRLKPWKEHAKENQSDTGIEGTYRPNMSEEDQKKWKAKFIQKGDDPRVEIRKTVSGPVTRGKSGILSGAHAQVLLIVRKPMSAFGDEPFVEMSANGKMSWSMTDWYELSQAVKEAWDMLQTLPEKTDG